MIDAEVARCGHSEEDGRAAVGGEGDGVVGEPIAIVD